MPGLDRVLVLDLPALATLLRCLRCSLRACSARALILGLPPLASVVHLAGNSLRNDTPRFFGLSRMGGRVFFRSVWGVVQRSDHSMVFGLPPRTQRLRFPG